MPVRKPKWLPALVISSDGYAYDDVAHTAHFIPVKWTKADDAAACGIRPSPYEAWGEPIGPVEVCLDCRRAVDPPKEEKNGR